LSQSTAKRRTRAPIGRGAQPIGERRNEEGAEPGSR